MLKRRKRLSTTLADGMLLSTVKIEATQGGRSVSTGTGFFWATQIDGGSMVSLMTNKHVIDGSDGLVIYMHTADTNDPSRPSGKNIRMNIEYGLDGVTRHPDPDVDLIALNVTSLINQAAADGYRTCYRTLTREDIPDARTLELFDSVEEVLMVGCPRGISDEYNNMPLVRRGITATSIRRDFNGKQEFMIDLACFPGSSGSPVFFLNQQDFLQYRQPDGSMKSKPKFALMGVLHAGPVVNNEGRLVLNQVPSVSVQTMMHLGQVIRSNRIIELDELILAEYARNKSALGSKDAHAT